MVNGMFIPGGTSIGYCAFGIFRDKNIFGEEADALRPERWLDDPPEKIKEQEQTLELVFSFGKYQCLGRNVALMELNKVFVEVSIRILRFLSMEMLTFHSSSGDSTSLLLIPRSQSGRMFLEAYS